MQTLPNGVQIPVGVNPAAVQNREISFLSGRTQIPGFIDLNASEISLFDADLKRLAFQTSLQRDLSSLLLSQRDAFLFAASIAKAQFKGRAFGGLLNGGGYNMQLIRPIKYSAMCLWRREEAEAQQCSTGQGTSQPRAGRLCLAMIPTR